MGRFKSRPNRINGNQLLTRLLGAVGASTRSGSGGNGRKPSGGAYKNKKPKGMKINTNMKHPSGGSMTETKKNKKKGPIKSPATGVSNSSVVIAYKPGKMTRGLKMISELCSLEQIDSFGALSLAGKQLTTVFSYIFTNGIARAAGLIPVSALMQDAYQYRNQTPAYNGPLVGGAATSQKLSLGSVFTETTLQNEGSGTAYVDIYDVVSKVTTVSYLDPSTQWASGLADEVQNSTASVTCPHTLPTASKLFNVTWKILRRTQVEISPGRGHLHRFTFKPRRIIDYEYFNKFQQVRGITCVQFLVHRGQVGDTVGTMASVGTVTIAPAKVVGTVRQKYNVRACTSNQRYLETINNLSLAPANLYNFDEGSGAVVDMLVSGG